MGTPTGRASWHLRSNAVVILYILAALSTGIVQRSLGEVKLSWLTIHLLLLGASSNAIVTWSDHFVSALLWTRSHDRRRQMTILILLNGGIIGVLVAVSAHIGWLIIASATLVSAVIVFYLHGIALLIKQSLSKRFVPVIRYYQSAALFILIGVLLGVIDTFKHDKDPWQPRIALAHLHANLLGWVGLTIMGTLVTLWPTMLRAQIHPRAISFAAKGLKFIFVGTLGAILSALIGAQSILAISILIYSVGVAITLAPSMFLIRTKKPDRASSWMLFTGIIGLMLLLTGDFIVVVFYRSPEKILAAIEGHILLVFTLWLLPTLLGSLIYLLPVVLGRGPAANRELEKIMNRGWRWRIMLLPTASLFLLLPSAFHPFGDGLIVLALGVFLGLALRAMWRARERSTAF